MTRLSASVLTASLLLALGACGGSGSSGPSEPSPALPAAEVYARRDAFYAYRTDSIGALAGSTYATRPSGSVDYDGHSELLVARAEGNARLLSWVEMSADFDTGTMNGTARHTVGQIGTADPVRFNGNLDIGQAAFDPMTNEVTFALTGELGLDGTPWLVDANLAGRFRGAGWLGLTASDADATVTIESQVNTATANLVARRSDS